MEFHTHSIQSLSIQSLFIQLGLDNQKISIDNFIAFNRPIPANIKLHEFRIWNDSQSAFIKQMKEEDADWAGIIDQLDIMLR